jgi:hypothetical protein
MLLPDLRSLRGSAPVVVERSNDVIERKLIAVPQVDEAVARSSAALAPAVSTSLGPHAHGDVAGRYFDRLPAALPR